MLRLGAIGLTPKDVAYVRALVRLFSNTDKLTWSFTEQLPFDAVVTDRAGRAADPGWFAAFDGPVLTLVAPPGAPENDTVAYPVHAEQFRAWLKLRHVQRAHTPAPAPQSSPVQQGSPVHKGAPVAAPERIAPPPVEAPVSAPASAAVSDAKPDAKPDATPNASPGQQVRPGQRRFKLRRWPSAAQLEGNALHLKIATLMVRNAIGTELLAVLTGHPESECRRFVDTLHRAGLLVEHAAHAEPAGLAAPAAQATDGAPAAPPVRSGLLASLRRHLGM